MIAKHEENATPLVWQAYIVQTYIYTGGLLNIQDQVFYTEH